MTAGLIVSRCGYYIVGGGASGTCYVWSSIGGNLLKTFKAHYRSCTCLEWSDCGRWLVTGGADGMVHFFSLLELVRKTTGKSKRSISPIHSWSTHTMKVNAIVSLLGTRMVTASDDGQLSIIELFSHAVIATIQLPHSIKCLVHHRNRLFAGSSHGTVYVIDLGAYAMHRTDQMGVANTAKRRKRNAASSELQASDVFHSGESGSDVAAGIGYQTELIGHEHAVTAISIASHESQDILISGDDSGTIRTWDIDSRGSLSMIRPWSSSAATAGVVVPDKKDKSGNKKSKKDLHPVTSILVLSEPEAATISVGNSPFAPGGRKSNASSIVRLLAPLKRYEQQADDEDSRYLKVPFMKPKRDMETLEYWDANVYSIQGDSSGGMSAYYTTENDIVISNGENDAATANNSNTNDDAAASISSKSALDATLSQAKHDAARMAKEENESLMQSLEDKDAELERLRKELAEQRSQVERWETVNNRLMQKLKKSGGK